MIRGKKVRPFPILFFRGGDREKHSSLETYRRCAQSGKSDSARCSKLLVIDLIEESLMKRTSLAVLMIALAILAMAAPMAFAQAPAPKVTINGLIDNLTSYSQNIDIYNSGVLNRTDKQWYGRTRGRFDIIGEVGKAKAVLGLELDETYGQTGNQEIQHTGVSSLTGGGLP